MTENEKRSPDEEVEAVKASEKKLPYCTTAPSAEHQRGEADDDPCDDGRAGK
ncbi:MAG: hypothetical protein JRK53_15635, partial [Deltaproteobacteria bacterium]|nr:hypothetical protein [Deltaproteobacteria bacterium]MBW1816328.1 hypothetical protein [Deltaproteobacteria bacterium]MBW2285741.1 hypothetical protein [Deltaproteobacteria bacterium]